MYYFMLPFVGKVNSYLDKLSLLFDEVNTSDTEQEFLEYNSDDDDI